MRGRKIATNVQPASFKRSFFSSSRFRSTTIERKRGKGRALARRRRNGGGGEPGVRMKGEDGSGSAKRRAGSFQACLSIKENYRGKSEGTWTKKKKIGEDPTERQCIGNEGCHKQIKWIREGGV